MRPAVPVLQQQTGTLFQTNSEDGASTSSEIEIDLGLEIVSVVYFRDMLGHNSVAFCCVQRSSSGKLEIVDLLFVVDSPILKMEPARAQKSIKKR